MKLKNKTKQQKKKTFVLIEMCAAKYAQVPGIIIWL